MQSPLKHPSPKERPLLLTILLSLIIALFTVEVLQIYPYLSGTISAPQGFSTGTQILYFSLSLLGIIATAAAFYGWKRWGVYGTVGILMTQILASLVFSTGKPPEILLKAALVAALVTGVGKTWKRMT